MFLFKENEFKFCSVEKNKAAIFTLILWLQKSLMGVHMAISSGRCKQAKENTSALIVSLATQWNVTCHSCQIQKGDILNLAWASFQASRFPTTI